MESGKWAAFCLNPETCFAVLPMANPYEKPLMYVRDCYQEYYDYTMALINSEAYQFVSILGSAGIGKSMFYVWFFDKYRSENPAHVIVCASFTENGEMISGFAYESGCEPKKVSSLKETPAAVYLCDGPPGHRFPPGRMVAFVPVGTYWDEHVRHNPRHQNLFMPVWTLSELISADHLLGLNIGVEEVGTRHAFFGGSARVCLADEMFVIDSKIELSRDLLEYTGDFSKRDGDVALSALSSRIFHSVPRYFHLKDLPDMPIFQTRIPCSRAVLRLITQNLATHKDTMTKLLDMI